MSVGPLLVVADLHAYYGKSHILQGVNFSIGAGEIVSLLGRNGVGRSTTIKAIIGDVPPQGSILFRGAQIAGMKPHHIARLGIGYVPENRDVFPTLSVRENLLLGQKQAKASGRWSMDEFFEWFQSLTERADTAAGVLSGGEQ
jgi:branched-chain amino acid transport system ATP-binding protein